MADRVYTAEDMVLGEEPDEITVTVRPNPISRQRKFMDRWDKNIEHIEKLQKNYEKAVEEAKAAGGKEEDVDEKKYEIDRFDGYIDLAAICLEKQLTGRVVDENGADASLFDNKGNATKEYRAYLEDILDTESIFRVIEVAGGIKLNDPNLVAAAMDLQEAEQSGQI